MSHRPSEQLFSFAEAFGPFHGHRWINCAHQGPLPKVAQAAAAEAINWKSCPSELTSDRFQETPARLRKLIAQLINADEGNVVLANSASYGLHLMANGIPLVEGDEVLVVDGDFPSDILPWLGLSKRGVTTRRVRGKAPLLDADELKSAITKRTRAFCTTWVHSFSGFAADIDSLGQVCKDHDVLFIVNGSQAMGTRNFDATIAPVDALTSVGFKWLCGPYGTGFCYVSENLLQRLEYNQQYWLSMMTADDLGQENPTVELQPGTRTARAFDIFGTANFFNYVPWTASIQFILDQGIQAIQQHDTQLVDRLIELLEPTEFEVTSSISGASRSNLVYVSNPDRARNVLAYKKLKDAKVDVAFRAGKLRFSPHIHNTADDIEAAVDVLSNLGD